MVVVFVVFVDLFRKSLILLTFLDFWLVDRLWFLRVVLWSCGSLVVFGSREAHCVSETGKATRSGINQGGMRVTCAKRTACKMARVAPTTRPQNRKRRAIVVFCRLCGFLASLWFFVWLVVFWRACGFSSGLWFFAVFVVFCRLCGFWASLWFFGELVVFGSRVFWSFGCRRLAMSGRPSAGSLKTRGQAQATRAGSRLFRCVSRARSALRARWQELRPRTDHKTEKAT